MPDSDCRKRMYGRMRSLRLYQLGEGSLVRAELESYLDVLEPMLAAIRAVQQDALLQSCSEQRLMAFERMLAIPINENIPLEERRQIAVGKASYQIGSYNGDGQASRTIAVEGEIGFGLIFMVGEVFNQTVTSSGDTYVYAAIITPQGCSKGVSIAEGGFTVQQSATSPMDGKRSMLNQSGMSYLYILFPPAA